MPDGALSSSPSAARLQAAFRGAPRPMVIPFVVGGHPSLAATEAAILALSKAGATVIEIGIPFSDPIADGPVIAAAMQQALRGGATPAQVFSAVGRARGRTDAALVAMVSASIVMRMAPERFLAAAAEAGMDAVIVPDLDSRVAPHLAELCAAVGMALVPLIAPDTGAERAAGLLARASGFVYMLGRQGVTGTSNAAAAAADSALRDVAARVKDLRALTRLPIAVGFGIGTAAQVAEVTAHADAAIVGSAIVRAMESATTPDAAVSGAAALFTALRGAAQ
ncbi:MAG: tryptophan synthase subunit alpha [Phycisphaerales bacterium]